MIKETVAKNAARVSGYPHEKIRIVGLTNPVWSFSLSGSPAE